MNTFNTDVLRGKIGELVVYDYLINNENIKEVFDCRKDKNHFQNEDVDFLIKTINGNIYKIEVKTDYRADKTQNIFYETKTSDNIGCFAKTKSDYVLYYLPNSSEILYIDVKKIREFVDENSDLICIKNNNNDSTGLLIPINTLLDKKIILKKEKI